MALTQEILLSEAKRMPLPYLTLPLIYDNLSKSHMHISKQYVKWLLASVYHGDEVVAPYGIVLSHVYRTRQYQTC